MEQFFGDPTQQQFEVTWPEPEPRTQDNVQNGSFGTGSLYDMLGSGDPTFIPSVEDLLAKSFENEPLDLNFPAVPGGGWTELNTANATETDIFGTAIFSTNNQQTVSLYGTPTPTQLTYDLNTTPRREVENIHTSWVAQYMQLAPITPDPARSGNAELPVVNFVEDVAINQEKGISAEKPISLPAIEAANTKNNELSQNIIENGVEVGIDLNRTPEQRTPKRKKHRPKVIREGKAKKIKTSRTPEKPNNVSGNPSGKRKYVRKKSLNGTPVTPQAEDEAKTRPAEEHTSVKSAKRALNFDLEEVVMETRAVAGPEQTIKYVKAAEVVHPSPRTQTREPTTNTSGFFGTGGTLLPKVAQQNRSIAQYRQENLNSSASSSTGRSSPIWQQILSDFAEMRRETSMNRTSHASLIVQDPMHNHIRGQSSDIGSTPLTAQMSRDMSRSYVASGMNQILRNGYLQSMALRQQQALLEQQTCQMREEGSMLSQMNWGDMMRGIQNHPHQPLIQAAPITPARKEGRMLSQMNRGDLMRGPHNDPRQPLIQAEPITPVRKQHNASRSATSPVQYKQVIQSKRNAPQSPAARKGPTTGKKETALSTIDEITRQLSNLHLGGGEEGAIVPYKGDGTIVPFEGKKRKPRPKVDLDPETSRVWNLLMGKENGEGLEENNQKTEKWWENEREVFRGRADSFIARMHLVQGDRRFSRWKGSVVDSVIGVFLTQNVSDHLSSSAFISLAAHFPLKSSSSIVPCDSGKIIVEEPEDSTNATGVFDSSTNLQLSCNQSPVAVHSTTERRDTEIMVPDHNMLEMQTHCSEEEAISSQGSFDCSAVDGSGGFRSYPGSNSESEDLGVSNKSEVVRQSASRTSTPGEKFMFQDINIQLHGNISPNHASESVHEELNDKRSINGSSGSTTLFAFESRNGCTVPLPASLYHLQMSSEVQVVNYDVFGEDITSSLSKASTSGDGVAREANGAAKQIKQSSESTGRSAVHEEKQKMDHHTECNKHQAHQNSCSKTGCQSIVTQPSEILLENITLEPNSTDLSTFTKTSKEETKAKQAKPKRAKAQADKKIDWDYLRRDVQLKSPTRERSEDSKDSLDYEAMRQASIKEISDTIKERGMNNMLAERIKDFLNRLVEEHGSIDLEWLRDVPPDKAKDYLLSIRGLGLKSVECVRLLTLHHLAFPVDTNVGRIAVRLGWVPLQPLPESLQLHLLELYPVLESIQKYLWPRLCKLDQRTLYELHYQLITFGKVFCTKSKPNCNACPMRGECRHFASAFASARLALPGPEDKSIVSSTVPVAENSNPVRINPVQLQSLENHSVKDSNSEAVSCQPIIEEPASPEQECVVQESDIEDGWGEEDDDDEIPTIKLNMEEFTENLQNFMQGNNMELQDGEMSKALVALNPTAACIPTRKLKNVSRLRTEHQVYELPDDHPLLEMMIKREPDDPSPYLLAIWTPGETADSVQPPEQRCQFEDTGGLCNEQTCFSCNSIREANSQTVRGTLLIPCRTAMRGSFPLNGTYFQVNEMFADHDTSLNPIDVPRNLIWNLRRRTVYFGTSVTSIFRGLTTEEIQFCFWKGFVCVRGFEQKARAPRPLVARLHLAASKMAKTKDEKTDKKG